MQKVSWAIVIIIILGWLAYPKFQDFIPNTPPYIPPPAEGEPIPLKLPTGFSGAVYADNLPGVRVITRGPGAAMFATQTSEGRVVALLDGNNDSKIEGVKTILEGLNGPHGIVLLCREGSQQDCNLYVAEENAVISYNFDPVTLAATAPEKIAALPSGTGHSTRSLLLHPAGKNLLVSVGSSCNVCHESNDRRAKILSINLETKEVSEFARGLRNTVFMTLHPITGEVWGTDMGRDFLGDDLPPDEVNIIREGKNYGWPNCYGKNIHDDVFDKNTYIRNPCMEPFEMGSTADFPAHSAPLGIAFVPEEGWPDEYWFNALVAYHGSWNRSAPTGYKIARLKWNAKGEYLGAEDFITGFITEGGNIIGRPVALLVEPGGNLFISDDKAGRIYRVFRSSQ